MDLLAHLVQHRRPHAFTRSESARCCEEYREGVQKDPTLPTSPRRRRKAPKLLAVIRRFHRPLDSDISSKPTLEKHKVDIEKHLDDYVRPPFVGWRINGSFNAVYSCTFCLSWHSVIVIPCNDLFKGSGDTGGRGLVSCREGKKAVKFCLRNRVWSVSVCEYSGICLEELCPASSHEGVIAI